MYKVFFKAPLPPYWLLLGSQMLMEPYPIIYLFHKFLLLKRRTSNYNCA